MVVMFVCFLKMSSVMNSIHSGKRLFPYTWTGYLKVLSERRAGRWCWSVKPQLSRIRISRLANCSRGRRSKSGLEKLRSNVDKAGVTRRPTKCQFY